MKKISIAVGMVAALVVWASPADAETIHVVSPMDTFGAITSRYGITRDELFGANPGKIRAWCFGIGEIRQTRWGSNARCRRMEPYVVVGTVLTIPDTRTALASQNQELRENLRQVTSERDSFEQKLNEANALRRQVSDQLEAARRENRHLSAQINQFRSAKAESATLAIEAAGIIGAVSLIIILILLSSYRGMRSKVEELSQTLADARRSEIGRRKQMEDGVKALASEKLSVRDREADASDRMVRADKIMANAAKIEEEANLRVQRELKDLRPQVEADVRKGFVGREEQLQIMADLLEKKREDLEAREQAIKDREDDSERERTRVKTHPMMAAVSADQALSSEEQEEFRRIQEEADGGNGASDFEEYDFPQSPRERKLMGGRRSRPPGHIR